MMMSSIVHASAWDKDIIQFATSLTLEQNSNLYHSTAESIDSSAYALSIANDSVSLFEGYGVALPFSIERFSYLQDKNLDNTAYRIDPGLRIFWSQDTALTISTGASLKQLLSGDLGAEFFVDTEQPIASKQRYANVSLQVGQAPKQQFFILNAGYIENEADASAGTARKHSQQVSSQYGYRISEDSYFQVSGSYAWQQANLHSTRLAEAGLGFLTGVGGSNEFNVIIGGYKRIDQQQTGVYWTLSNQWQASQRVAIDFSTSQRSVLNNGATNVSQLTTIYQIHSDYKLSDNHRLSLVLRQQRSEIKANRHANRQQHASLTWQWHISTGLALNSYINVTNFRRVTVPESTVPESSNSDQQKWGMTLGYQW